MRYSTIISLIYAHAIGSEEMWEKAIEELFRTETLKGNEVLARDIKDANEGILHTGSDIDPPSFAVLSKDRK